MNDFWLYGVLPVGSRATSNPPTLHYDFVGRTHERPVECTQEAVATRVTTPGNREANLPNNIRIREGARLMAVQGVDEPSMAHLANCDRRVKKRHDDSVPPDTRPRTREAIRLKAVQGGDGLVKGYLAMCDRGVKVGHREDLS